jgi:uncharacterized protein (DUF302 family)
MMRPLLLILLWFLPSAARETVNRLEFSIIANGWTIFAKVDHTVHAARQGVEIPARTTIAFAYMRIWLTPLIENPTVAMEMPTTVLVWEDGEGVWVTRNTTRYNQRQLARHEAKVQAGLQIERDELLAKLIDNAAR